MRSIRLLAEPFFKILQDFYEQRLLRLFEDAGFRSKSFSLILLNFKEAILLITTIGISLPSDSLKSSQRIIFRPETYAASDSKINAIEGDFLLYVFLVLNFILIIFLLAVLLIRPALPLQRGLHFIPIIFLVYEYIIYIPSILISMQHFSDNRLLVLINTIFTIIIGMSDGRRKVILSNACLFKVRSLFMWITRMCTKARII